MNLTSYSFNINAFREWKILFVTLITDEGFDNEKIVTSKKYKNP